MKVFLAGAGGAIGRRLVPQLVSAGHEVIGTTRSPKRFPALARLGAHPMLMDGLNPDSVWAAVNGVRPEVVIHQLTALTGMGTPRNLDREFVETNRLRTEATDHLLAAARHAGARRLIAQSFTGWTNARSGSFVKNEYDPLDPDPVAGTTQSLDAIRHIEQTVPAATGLEGIVLRYGFFYGSGTSLGLTGPIADALRHRKFPMVGGGTGIFSFIHVDDAAGATVRALDHGSPGIYNVVDDEPARVSEWLPDLADVVGAKPPRRVPGWLARPLIGGYAMLLMTSARGSSNAKAKRELGWHLRYPSWRQGFRTGMGAAVPVPPAGISVAGHSGLAAGDAVVGDDGASAAGGGAVDSSSTHRQHAA